MPQAIFDKLNYSMLMATSMCLQLADQSVCYTIGITENIPVKIRNFFVPVDFVVLDMQEDMKTPLILDNKCSRQQMHTMMSEQEKSNSISMEKKSDSPLSQD
jgi:hypothetical protein